LPHCAKQPAKRHKQQLAADATTAAQERDEQPREYRHSLEQMFPKGSVITPDNDEAYYGL